MYRLELRKVMIENHQNNEDKNILKVLDDMSEISSETSDESNDDVQDESSVESNDIKYLNEDSVKTNQKQNDMYFIDEKLD
jgi:hypothetical protein